MKRAILASLFVIIVLLISGCGEDPLLDDALPIDINDLSEDDPVDDNVFDVNIRVGTGGERECLFDSGCPPGTGCIDRRCLDPVDVSECEGIENDLARHSCIRYIALKYNDAQICRSIVTSPTGAAIRDMLNVARRRFANIEIILCPVRVQGDGARDEIAAAIKDLNRLGTIDVMIVGRGGGSLEDLWAFNEEVVARAIYDSKVPVISAVGHEIDYTIADFVADLRAPTPSAAAELVIPRKEDLIAQIATNTTRLGNALANMVEMLARRLAAARDSYALKQPLKMVEQYEQMIDDLRKDMAIRADHLVQMRGQDFNMLAQKLEALSPLAILNRGYSITTRVSDGKIMKAAADAHAGDRVETKLGKGKFVSRVEEIG